MRREDRSFRRFLFGGHRLLWLRGSEKHLRGGRRRFSGEF